MLQVKEKNQDTLDKVEVIANKAEMIDSLIGNMFHATLEELEVLKVEPEERSSLLVEEMILEQKYYGEIVLENHSINGCILSDQIKNLDYRQKNCNFIEKATEEEINSVVDNIKLLIE